MISFKLMLIISKKQINKQKKNTDDVTVKEGINHKCYFNFIFI